jgi:hypothetical protein
VTAYVITLYLHSYLRWGVVALALLVAWRALRGWSGARPWTGFDELAHVALLKAAYVQFLLGLILYVFLSPYTSVFMSHFRLAIEQPALRFFGMLHVGGMFAAVGILHEGRKASLRAASERSRCRRVGVTTLLALGVICAAMPWPVFEYGRPLFRHFA